MLAGVVGIYRLGDRRVGVFARAARNLRLRADKERSRLGAVDSVAVSVDVKACFGRILIEKIGFVAAAVDGNAAFAAVGIDLVHVMELDAQLAFGIDAAQGGID